MPRGRIAGSKNVKHRAALIKMLHDKFGEDFDPLQRMAEQAIALADAADESCERQDRDSAVMALEKVTKYIHPQLKATEVDLTSSDGTMAPPSKIKLIAVYDTPEGETAELEQDTEHRLTEVTGSPESASNDEMTHGMGEGPEAA